MRSILSPIRTHFLRRTPISRKCCAIRSVTAGYQNGVCTIVGRAKRSSEPLFMERLPVNSCDDAALFAAKLAGAYDWIATSQYISKVGKAAARRLLWR